MGPENGFAVFTKTSSSDTVLQSFVSSLKLLAVLLKYQFSHCAHKQVHTLQVFPFFIFPYQNVENFRYLIRFPGKNLKPQKFRKREKGLATATT
jgi:hypothetical protein